MVDMAKVSLIFFIFHFMYLFFYLDLDEKGLHCRLKYESNRPLSLAVRQNGTGRCGMQA